MISVLMPTYNHARFLPMSIASILGQKCEHQIELIIIDDCSTDETPDLLQQFSKNRPGIIRVDRNKTNIGLTRSLNIALDMANGRYIARQDADDIAHPYRFAASLTAFDAKVGFCTVWGAPIDESGNKIAKQSSQKPFEYYSRINEKESERLLSINKYGLMDPTMIFKREVFEKIGYFDERLYLCQGYNYLLRARKFFEYRIIQEVLYTRRKYPGSTSIRLKGTTLKGSHVVRLARERAESHPIILRKGCDK